MSSGIDQGMSARPPSTSSNTMLNILRAREREAWETVRDLADAIVAAEGPPAAGAVVFAVNAVASARTRAEAALAALDEEDGFAINHPSTESPRPTGIERIAAERRRQIGSEGYTDSHDDQHDAGQIALAAVCYAAAASGELVYLQRKRANSVSFVDPWPWERKDDARPYPGRGNFASFPDARADRIRLLEKAGALVAAEIDRLLRLPAEKKPEAK